jgi:hypothetical protein
MHTNPLLRVTMRRATHYFHAIADESWRLRIMSGRYGRRAWHRDPATVAGYGVLVSLGERSGGEQCPQCGESDLQPYGNGSKLACPRCYFIVPCCEGGEMAAQSKANLERGAPQADPGRP